MKNGMLYIAIKDTWNKMGRERERVVITVSGGDGGMVVLIGTAVVNEILNILKW